MMPPAGPRTVAPTSTASTTSSGESPTLPFITRGTSTLPSIIWIATMKAITPSASRHDWVSAISTAGMPLSQGPKKGMISKSPARTPRSSQNFSPIAA